MKIDLVDVFHAAKERDVAVEIDAQPQRLDLDDVHAHRARELGVKVVINRDAPRSISSTPIPLNLRGLSASERCFFAPRLQDG